MQIKGNTSHEKDIKLFFLDPVLSKFFFSCTINCLLKYLDLFLHFIGIQCMFLLWHSNCESWTLFLIPLTISPIGTRDAWVLNSFVTLTHLGQVIKDILRWGAGNMESAWPSCPRGMRHRFSRLESIAPGALCAFQFLRNQGTPLGSEAFRPLCVYLYVPLEVKQAWKLDRTTGLRNSFCVTFIAYKSDCILATTTVSILVIATIFCFW